MASKQQDPGFALAVIHPFGDYAKGQHITDPAEIQKVLAGENAASVNKIQPPPADAAPQA